MRHITPTAIALLATIWLATPVLAQGRHDEKPHGVMKPTTATEQQRTASTGGRHDEGPTSHGKKKPTNQTKKGASEKGASEDAAASK